MARLSLMRPAMKTSGVAICFALSAACVEQPPVSTDSTSSSLEIDNVVQHPHAGICNGGRFRCFAQRQTDGTGRIKSFATPQGLGADQLKSAYNLDTSIDPGATIAIVDAFGYAALATDLAAYRAQYGLPPCTVASGCLKIVNQNGQASPLPSDPPANDDWTGETALDVDMASAACPKCKILVVQADNDSGDGLYQSQMAAASLGATVISNSWGGPEDSSVSGSESYFNHPGIAIFVASGDSGYNDGGQGPDYPSTSAYAIAVGGTTLQTSTNARGWTEKAWSGGGSSCSQNIAKPAWQTSTACTKRMASDVSAVGDPNTGLAVYNKGRWQVVGGTSASSPLVAGIYALTKNGGATAQFAYQNATAFYDVTTGTNGTCTAPLCKSAAGWDGPTGIGTPNGAALAALGTGAGSGSGSGSGSASGGGGSGSGSGGGSGGNGSGVGSGSDGGSAGGGGGGGTGSGSGGGGGGSNGDNDGNGDTEHGGCASTTGGGFGAGVLVIGLATVARRRRRR